MIDELGVTTSEGVFEGSIEDHKDAAEEYPQPSPSPPLCYPDPSLCIVDTDSDSDDELYYRYVSEQEKKEIEQTAMLRGGRPGQTFFTTDRYETAQEAHDKLALPARPDYRIQFTISSSAPIFGPEDVTGKVDLEGQWRPGGGKRWTWARRRL